MGRRQVPLNGLRAFEAAARHLSFAAAADELGVTPAAVSHQIRSLEDVLGEALFVRGPRAIELTPSGKACLPHLRQAFDQIDQAVHTATNYGRSRTLFIRSSPCVGSKWLMPRLPRFQKEHPDIEVTVSASSDVYSLRPGEIDAILRLRHGEFENVVVDRVLTEEVFPVCSPELVASGNLRTPNDLSRFTLLHDETLNSVETVPSWERWLEYVGASDVDSQRGHRFSMSTLVIDATLAGRGVSLGRSALVEEELAEGRLVRPFEIRYPARHDYCLIYPKESEGRDDVMAFRDWVLEEGAAHHVV